MGGKHDSGLFKFSYEPFYTVSMFHSESLIFVVQITNWKTEFFEEQFKYLILSIYWLRCYVNKLV